MNASESHPLDNVIWTALTTTHAPLAFGHGLALHYPRDVAPFSAIAEPTPAAYDDLAHDLPPGVEARLVRPREEPAPPGWDTLSARPIVQMLAESVPPSIDNTGDDDPAVPVRPLTAADTDDMLALVGAAKPGPFGARTILLGGYLGIRAKATGRLLAMAGERLRLPGHAEVSAVSVHPDARGRKLGFRLTSALMRQILARGEVPFLHVYADNPAMALYARMGFRERARPWVIWRRKQAASPTGR